MSAALTVADGAALLGGLSEVVARYRADAEAGGLEAVRLLRLAGASWTDVLPGPAYADDDYALKLIGYGFRTNSSSFDCGRAMRLVLHIATPYQLATVAVLANLPDPDFDEAEQLASIVRKLLAMRVDERRTV